MTYFQRQRQLERTLISIEKSQAKDFSVIIVDDCSVEDIQLPKVSFPVNILKIRQKRWINPDPAYNIGLASAVLHCPEFIILQNAECYHVGDVIQYAIENTTNQNYLAFSCFSLDENTTNNHTEIQSIIQNNNQAVKRDGDNGWYNHPVHRPVGFEFCSSITTRNIIKLNGYDERLSHGWAYGDNFLLHRIKKLGLQVVIPEHPFVVHQWHPSSVIGNKRELMRKNKERYLQLEKEDGFRAKHYYTSNLEDI